MFCIHPAALVSPSAEIAADAVIGPFAIIGDNVHISEGCRIEAHAQILPGVRMGARNLIDRGAIVGGNPQSIGFDPRIASGVLLGDDNIIREHVTIHRSLHERGHTAIGHRNYFMAACHLGHDVRIGDDNVLANAVLLAGHVTAGNRCFLGGGAVFHQFIRIGDCAMAQGNSSFSADVPPCCVVSGLNTVNGLNSTGLRRAGIDRDARLALRRAWHLVFRHPNGPVKAAAEAAQSPGHPEIVLQFLQFIAAAGPKGICTAPHA